MIIFVCDKCGTHSEPKDSHAIMVPKDWRELSFQIKYQNQKKLFVCPDCCKAMKIDAGEYLETVRESLVEILTEIAQDAIQD